MDAVIKCRLIYLCKGNDEYCENPRIWAGEAIRKIKKKNIMCISPDVADYKLYFEKKILPGTIVSREKGWIFTCDTLLVHMNIPSVRASMLMMLAWTLQKQIILVSSIDSPWLIRHANYHFEKLEDAIDCLELEEPETI